MSEKSDKFLTEEQIEHIAEKAANKAIEKITHQLYEEIGRRLVSKLLTGVGVVTVVFLGWLASQGWIK